MGRKGGEVRIEFQNIIAFYNQSIYRPTCMGVGSVVQYSSTG